MCLYVFYVCKFDSVADLICNHEQIELQAKLLNYFLGSNKSNINQKSDTAEFVRSRNTNRFPVSVALLCEVDVLKKKSQVVAPG